MTDSKDLDGIMQTEMELMINQIMSLPRTETRKWPACSLEAAQKGIQLSWDVNYLSGIAYGHLLIGEYHLFSRLPEVEQQSTEGIQKNLSRALEIFLEANDTAGMMLAYRGLGFLQLKKNDFGEAASNFKQAIRLAKMKSGDSLFNHVFVDALVEQAVILCETACFTHAEELLQEAFSFCCANDMNAKTAEVLQHIGIFERIRTQPDTALKRLIEASEMALEQKEHHIVADCYRVIAQINLEMQQYDVYEFYMEKHLEYFKRAVEDETEHEIRILRSYYLKENARIICEAEKKLEERLLERNQELEVANWRLSTISSIGQKLTASLDLKEVYYTLFSEIGVLMDADGFIIAEYDEKKSCLDYVAAYKHGYELDLKINQYTKSDSLDFWGYKHKDWEIDRYSRRESEQTQVYQKTSEVSKASEAVNGSKEKGLFIQRIQQIFEQDFNTVLVILLTSKGKPLGVLSIQSDRENAYNKQQIKMLESLSTYVSIAIENARIYRKLDDMSKEVLNLANHDSLTNMANRRLLFELIPKVYANAERSSTKAAFLYMDLDNFKRINDKFGHQTGDKVLKEFVARVGKTIRATDVFARVGGDEFVVVMTDLKNHLNAAKLARKIIQEVSRPMDVENQKYNIGVSIGISVYPDDGKETELLLMMADKAMYRIKREGKNNFCFCADNLKIVENSINDVILTKS